MTRCPKCRRPSVAGAALLPGTLAVVCRDCFKELTGHDPLPSARPLGMLTLHQGQSLSDSAQATMADISQLDSLILQDRSDKEKRAMTIMPALLKSSRAAAAAMIGNIRV